MRVRSPRWARPGLGAKGAWHPREWSVEIRIRFLALYRQNFADQNFADREHSWAYRQICRLKLQFPIAVLFFSVLADKLGL